MSDAMLTKVSSYVLLGVGVLSVSLGILHREGDLELPTCLCLLGARIKCIHHCALLIDYIINIINCTELKYFLQ